LIAASPTMVTMASAVSPIGSAGELERVPGEGDRDRRHSTGVDDQEHRPATEEGHQRMEGLPEVGVLASHRRHPLRQLGVDEGAHQGHHPPHDPRPEDERRGVHVLGDDGRVDEDARADDAAHDQQGGLERPIRATRPGWPSAKAVPSRPGDPGATSPLARSRRRRSGSPSSARCSPW
jgi:hypothetical protein